MFSPSRASGIVYGPDASSRGFLDNVTISPSVGAPSSTSPWVAVAAGAALLTGLIALARYYDEKKGK